MADSSSVKIYYSTSWSSTSDNVSTSGGFSVNIISLTFEIEFFNSKLKLLLLLLLTLIASFWVDAYYLYKTKS